MAKTDKMVMIPSVNLQRFKLQLVGDSPLIVHRFSEKAKKQMLDKQMKKAKTAKAAKDPQEDYEGSMYRFKDGGHGFPVSGFEATAVNACRQIDGVAMTEVRGAFRIVNGEDDLIRLDAAEPVMRQDMVKIAMGTSDIRFRAMYDPWSVVIEIMHNADFMSKEQIINLYNVAGFCSGIGEWRPSSPKRAGPYGMFHVGTNGGTG